MFPGLVNSQYLSSCPSTWVLTTCYRCRGDYELCGNNRWWGSMSNTDCRALIDGNSVVAVHYDVDSCAKYDCFYNTYYYDTEARWETWATCNYDCTNFTLSRTSNYEVVSAEIVAVQWYVDMGLCFYLCFNLPQCYTFTWNSGNNECKLYTACGTSCATTYNSNVDTYVRSCHARKYDVVAVWELTAYSPEVLFNIVKATIILNCKRNSNIS